MGLNRIRILYLGDAALARECLGRPGGSIEIVETNPPSSLPADLSSYDLVFVEYPCRGVDMPAVFREVGAHGAHVPVVLVADWNEKLAVAALKFGAADYVIKSQPSFRAVYFRLHRYLAQASAAAELTSSKTQLDEAQAAASRAQAALQLAEQRAERAKHDASIEKEIGAQKIMQLVAKAEAARQEATESRAQFEAFERKIADGAAAFERAKQQHAKETDEAAARYAEMIRKLAETAATLARAQEDAAAEQAAATERRNQIELELSREQTNRADLAQQLAAVNETFARAKEQHEAQIREAQSRHDDAQRKLAATASTLDEVRQKAAQEEAAAAQYRNQIEAELSREQTNRADLAQQLATVNETLARAKEQHEAQIREAQSRHEEVERTLAEAASTLEGVRQNAAQEQRAAAEQLAQLKKDLADQQASYLALEQRLAEVNAELERARQQHTETAAALTRAQQDAAAEQAAATERRERIEQELFREHETREALADQLAETTAAFENLRKQAAVEREEASQLYGQIVADLAKETASREGLQQRYTVEMAEADSRRAQLEKTIAEAAAALESAKGEAASERRDADERFDRIQSQLEAETVNRKSVEEQLSEVRAELESAKSNLAELRGTIDQLDRDSRVRFGRTPISSGRCRPDGTLTHVNQALATLLGYDSTDELQAVDFASDVLESGDELKRLAARCASSRSLETFETTLRKKDGMRIIVRILGVAATRDAVDLTVVDMMPVRVLEERLRSSQRMEAVARYGSEVAATCHNLLSHVKEEGQHWLARISSDSARQQGELLLDDVTRADGFLRQLEAYGLEQKNLPQRVDVKEVLRALEPVLTRVAGGEVKLVLPKSSAPLNVDIDGERIERMLVNVAAFGRDRIQEGGLSIKVAAVDLDSAFVAKYPSVRPGPHVLITVAKVGKPGANGRANSPGIDLGALQALVTECGGHLWMMTEPPGDMILKIHLPRTPLSFAATPAGWISHALGARN